VANLLVAAANTDLKLFKSVFPEEFQKQVKDEQWPEFLRALRSNIRQALGDYRAEEVASMRFEFTGDDTAGSIDVRTRTGKVLDRTPVRKEGAGWKILQRLSW
jgi:hypothetical protein